jgi:hypothetical protein
VIRSIFVAVASMRNYRKLVRFVTESGAPKGTILELF